jgi:hypothetical protein
MLVKYVVDSSTDNLSEGSLASLRYAPRKLRVIDELQIGV